MLFANSSSEELWKISSESGWFLSLRFIGGSKLTPRMYSSQWVSFQISRSLARSIMRWWQTSGSVSTQMTTSSASFLASSLRRVAM